MCEFDISTIVSYKIYFDIKIICINKCLIQSNIVFFKILE